MCPGLSDLHWSSQLFHSPEQTGAPQTAVPGEKVSACQMASCHRPRLQVSPSLPSARANTPEHLQTKWTGRYPGSSTWLGRQVREWMVSGQGDSDKQQTPRTEGRRSLTWHKGKQEEGPQPPKNTAILECRMILTWAILKMIGKLPQFKCTLSEWLKKTNKEKVFYQQFHNSTLKNPE